MLESEQPAVCLVSPETAHDTRKRRRSSEDFHVRREYAMGRHSLALLADQLDDVRGWPIRQIE